MNNSLIYVQPPPCNAVLELLNNPPEIELEPIEISACIVCNGKSYKQICDECNSIYKNIIGVTFESEEDKKDFFDNEDIPPHLLRKLGREFSIYLYGP